MFRPMRRKSKEIDLQAAKELLHRARYGVLLFRGTAATPMQCP